MRETSSPLAKRPEIDGRLDTLEDLMTIPRGDSAFEALPTLEAIRLVPAEATIRTEAPLRLITHAMGHDLVERLGSHDGFDFYIGERKDGVSRRAIIKSAARGEGYAQRRRRLLAEARLGASFDHPNLTRVQDAGEDDRGAHVVYEHVDGTNLERASARLRQRNEAFPFELCAWIVREVARGLALLHAVEDGGRGLVLEVVPANVLIARSGHVKLALFAFPWFGAGLPSGPQDVAYLAPERIMRSGSDRRSDLYSAGVLLFELLSGRSCFPGLDTREVVSRAIHDGLPLRSLVEEAVPPGLIDIIAGATARDPADRFQSADDLAGELSAWIEASGTPPDRPGDQCESIVVRFFERQGLFDGDVSSPTGRFETALGAMEEDATEMIDAHRERMATIRQPNFSDPEDGPSTRGRGSARSRPPTDFGNTLSAVVIREEIELPQPPPARESQQATQAVSGIQPGGRRFRRSELRSRQQPPLDGTFDQDPAVSGIQRVLPPPTRPPPPRVDETTYRLEVESPTPPQRSRSAVGDGRAIRSTMDRRYVAVVVVTLGIAAAVVAVGRSRAPRGRVTSVEVIPSSPEAQRPVTAHRASVVIGSVPAAERGILEIDTQPPVRIFRGSELIGRTPIAIELPSGSHELRFVEQSGGLSTTRRYEIAKGKVLSDRVRFEKSELEIDAPEGARLYLDQRYLGRAPVARVDVFEGRHVLKVVAGKETLADRIDVGPSQRIHYRVEVP